MTASATADLYAPDGPYAYRRLALSLAAATLVGAGNWAIIVVLPLAQAEFGVDRASASAPYTAMMIGFAAGTIALGRLADRVGIVAPLAFGGLALGLGFVLAGLSPNLVLFGAAHALLIGVAPAWASRR